MNKNTIIKIQIKAFFCIRLRSVFAHTLDLFLIKPFLKIPHQKCTNFLCSEAYFVIKVAMKFIFFWEECQWGMGECAFMSQWIVKSGTALFTRTGLPSKRKLMWTQTKFQLWKSSEGNISRLMITMLIKEEFWVHLSVWYLFLWKHYVVLATAVRQGRSFPGTVTAHIKITLEVEQHVFRQLLKVQWADYCIEMPKGQTHPSHMHKW